MFYDSENATYLKRVAWTTVPGNSIVRTYYTGVDTYNPSGSFNIHTETFLKYDNSTEFVISYVWDINDNCLTETCSNV